MIPLSEISSTRATFKRRELLSSCDLPSRGSGMFVPNFCSQACLFQLHDSQGQAFCRFGSFEILTANGEVELLRQLADFVIERYFLQVNRG